MTSQVKRPGKAALANEVAGLVYALTRAWDARMEAAVGALARRESVNLTARQALAVWHLYEPLTMGQLAESLACDQSNVTGIVDRLERAGLVERVIDSDDRRVKRLVLSSQGKAIRQKLDGALGAEPALAELAMTELRQLRDLLTHAYALSGPIPDPHIVPLAGSPQRPSV